MLAEVSNAGWVNEYISLLHDPAHILFEFTNDFVQWVIAAAFGAVWVRRHDDKHHNLKRKGK